MALGTAEKVEEKSSAIPVAAYAAELAILDLDMQLLGAAPTKPVKRSGSKL
jgi:hypothetical protein